MAIIEDVGALRDFLGYAIVYAPEFPEEDFLGPAEQMNLDLVWTELEAGLRFVPGIESNSERLRTAVLLLAAAREAYESGDLESGATLLQDLDRELFGS